MANVKFVLDFKYDIKYKLSDTLYFGINLLLGDREFPLRLNARGTTGTSSGKDISPRSERTFDFSSNTEITASFTETNIDAPGIDDITTDMLFSDSNRNKLSFRFGSVALRQIVEFDSRGSLNDFFNTQYTEISDIDLTVITDSSITTKLVGPNMSQKVKLGKQYGEILLLRFSS